MSFSLTAEQIAAISKHALEEYPKESCGLIAGGLYFPCVNAADKPESDFVIPAGAQVQIRESGRTIEAVVHSHPNGPRFPSEADMKGQLATKLPWVLVSTDGAKIQSIELWGDGVDPAPLIGREFMHGVRDCYSLVRDVYRLGREGMKAQGMGWPLEPIPILDFARNDGWWGDEKQTGQTLYEDNFAAQGFVRITREQARPGDGFLIKIKSQTPNHAAVLLEDGTMLHHLPMRMSRREPVGRWASAADVWLHYEGKK